MVKGVKGAVAKKASAKPKCKVAPSLHVAAPSSRKSNEKANKQLESKVARALKTHFAHVPHEVIANKLVDGKSLKSRLLEDMGRLQGTRKRLGTTYWSELTAKYAQNLMSVDGLVVKDAAGEIGDSLIHAMAHVRSTCPAERDASHLLRWLETHFVITQRELVGLVRAVAKSAFRGTKTQDELWVALGRFAGHINMPGNFPQEFAAIKEEVDASLVKHWERFKRLHVKPATFIRSFGPAVLVLMPEALVQKVVASKDLTTCMSILARCSGFASSIAACFPAAAVRFYRQKPMVWFFFF